MPEMYTILLCHTSFFCTDSSQVNRQPLAASEAQKNATLSLLLPGKVLYLNALLAQRKFRDRGNKAGDVRGFEALQEDKLGKLVSIKPQRGATMVRKSSISYRAHKYCMSDRYCSS